MKRGRNQRRRPGGGSNPNRALDSNGPDVRIRGTATQIYDKYQALARDASSAGDRVKAESYLQHAEHYYRLIRSMQPAQTPNQSHSSPDSDADQPGVDDGDNNDQHREQRSQREHRNHAADESETGLNASASAPAAAPAAAQTASDGDGEEERKPRRRRAPRRTVKKDDVGADDKTPAAAE